MMSGTQLTNASTIGSVYLNQNVIASRMRTRSAPSLKQMPNNTNNLRTTVNQLQNQLLETDCFIHNTLVNANNVRSVSLSAHLNNLQNDNSMLKIQMQKFSTLLAKKEQQLQGEQQQNVVLNAQFQLLQQNSTIIQQNIYDEIELNAVQSVLQQEVQQNYEIINQLEQKISSLQQLVELQFKQQPIIEVTDCQQVNNVQNQSIKQSKSYIERATEKLQKQKQPPKIVLDEVCVDKYRTKQRNIPKTPAEIQLQEYFLNRNTTQQNSNQIVKLQDINKSTKQKQDTTLKINNSTNIKAELNKENTVTSNVAENNKIEEQEIIPNQASFHQDQQNEDTQQQNIQQNINNYQQILEINQQSSLHNSQVNQQEDNKQSNEFDANFESKNDEIQELNNDFSPHKEQTAQQVQKQTLKKSFDLDDPFQSNSDSSSDSDKKQKKKKKLSKEKKHKYKVQKEQADDLDVFNDGQKPKSKKKKKESYEMDELEL